MQERAMGLQKVSLTRAPRQLAPRAAAGMSVGTDVAKPEPASIGTAPMGTALQRGVDCTWASVGRRPRLGSPLRRGRGMVGLGFTRGTVRLLRKALEGLGCVGACTRGGGVLPVLEVTTSLGLARENAG